MKGHIFAVINFSLFLHTVFAGSVESSYGDAEEIRQFIISRDFVSDLALVKPLEARHTCILQMKNEIIFAHNNENLKEQTESGLDKYRKDIFCSSESCRDKSGSVKNLCDTYKIVSYSYNRIVESGCNLELDIIRLYNIGYILVDKIVQILISLFQDIEARNGHINIEEIIENYVHQLAIELAELHNTTQKDRIREFLQLTIKKADARTIEGSLCSVLTRANAYFYKLFVAEESKPKFVHTNTYLLDIYYSEAAHNKICSLFYSCIDLHYIYTKKRIEEAFLGIKSPRDINNIFKDRLRKNCPFTYKPEETFAYSMSIYKHVKHYQEIEARPCILDANELKKIEPYDLLFDRETYIRTLTMLIDPNVNVLAAETNALIRCDSDSIYPALPILWELHPLMHYLLSNNIAMCNFVKTQDMICIDLLSDEQVPYGHRPLRLKELCKLSMGDKITIQFPNAEISTHISKIILYLKKGAVVYLVLQPLLTDDSDYYFSSVQNDVRQRVYDQVRNAELPAKSSFKGLLVSGVYIIFGLLAIGSNFLPYKLYNSYAAVLAFSAILRLALALNGKQIVHSQNGFNVFSIALCITLFVHLLKTCRTIKMAQVDTVIPMALHSTLCLLVLLLLVFSIAYSIYRYSFGSRRNISFIIKTTAYILACACATIGLLLFILWGINTESLSTSRYIGIFSGLFLYAAASMEKGKCSISIKKRETLELYLSLVSVCLVVIGIISTLCVQYRSTELPQLFSRFT